MNHALLQFLSQVIGVLLEALGYFVSCGVGAWAIKRVSSRLRAISDQTIEGTSPSPALAVRTPAAIALWQGIGERALYTTAALTRPEGIAVWLVFKALVYTRGHENDPEHAGRTALFIIGTLMDIAFGLVGAYFADAGLALL